MKTRIISSIALLLLLALAIGNLAACKTNKAPVDTGTVSDVESTKGGEKEEYDPGTVNYGGYDYEMLTETNHYHYSLYAYEGDSTPSQVTDVALWYREAQMKEYYGVNLVLNNRGSDKETGALATVRNTVGTGQATADVLMLNGENTMVAAQDGLIYDVNTLPNLNLEASYWDQRIQTEYKVGTALYCLDGDFNFADDLATYVVIYNDMLYDKYGYYDTYGSPYELASQGKWTYEKMQLMILDRASDKDGGGEMNENDIWGMISETSLPYYFALGSGEKMLSNKDGEFTLNLLDETRWNKMQQILTNMMALVINKDTLIAGGAAGNYLPNSADLWNVASDVFKYDRALFRTTSLSAVNRLLDMESNYGIMPIPAYEETAPEDAAYYCWLQPYLHYPMSFPVSLRDVEQTTEITEIFAYTSKYGADSLYTAFFDLLSYARLCRTADDVEMLKLVFANKCYDIDQALSVTRLFTWVSSGAKNNATVDGAMGVITTNYTPEHRNTIDTKMKEIVLNFTTEGKSYPLS